MFKRISQRKINVDYILTDSWFTSMNWINNLLTVNKKVHIIEMYKYNSKLSIDGKEHSIKELRKRRQNVKEKGR